MNRAGLSLYFRIWGDQRNPVVLLQHGARDHGRSWDFVVAGLVDDYCVVTPDLRGHGDSGHVPGGGYDGLDFVTDFAAILQDLERRGFSSPFRIVGHSLGGNVSSHYASAFPEKVIAFVNIEGVGTPPQLYSTITQQPAAERWRMAAEKLLEQSSNSPRIFSTPELAVRRMKQLHARVPANIVEHVALHAIRQIDGGFSWKYDSLLGFFHHRPQSPEEYIAIYQAISCPVLVMYGANSFATSPETDGRGQVYKDQQFITYEGAAHWLHHEQSERFVSDIRAFLSRF